MRTVAIVAGAVLAFTIAYAADPPKAQVTPVTRTNTTVTGQPIVVPDRPDVNVSIATFPPGARLAEHQPPHPHFVSVLQRVLTVVDTDAHQPYEAKAGASRLISPAGRRWDVFFAGHLLASKDFPSERSDVRSERREKF